MSGYRITQGALARAIAGDWDRSFRYLWGGASAAFVGSQLGRFALPLLAASHTTSPVAISLVALALSAPWLVIGLPAGAIVDRLDRRTILLWVNWSRAAAFAALAGSVAADGGALPLLYLAAILLGTGDVFAETTVPALVPMVVPAKAVDDANARLYGAMAVAEIVVAPLGGALAGIALGWAVGAAAGWFGGAALLLAAMPGRFRPVGAPRRHLLAEIGEGLRFLWEHRLLRSITLMAAVINGCWSAWGALMVLYAVRPGPMGLTEFAYGWLLTTAGIGGVAGTWCAPAVQRRLGLSWAIGINIAGNGIMFLTTAVTANPWLIAPAVIIGNVGGPLWVIAVLGLQARTVPEGLRGRVAGAYRFVSFGAMAIGAPLGGWAAEAYGLRAVFAGCAALTLALLVPFAFSVARERIGILPEESSLSG